MVMTSVTSSGALVILFLPHPLQDIAAVCVSVLIEKRACLFLSVSRVWSSGSASLTAVVRTFDFMLIQ